MYSIIQAPNEILRIPVTAPVDFSGPRLTKIIAEMKATLLFQKDPEGVGLAANQVGLPYRLFVAHSPAGRQGFDIKKEGPVLAFINPEIVAHCEEFQEDRKNPLEGCLSLPKYYGSVKRWQWIKVKYQTVDSSQWTVDRFEGFPAVVIQHEMDHLAGKIFVERILEQNGKLYKAKGRDRHGKEIWEEVEI